MSTGELVRRLDYLTRLASKIYDEGRRTFVGSRK